MATKRVKSRSRSASRSAAPARRGSSTRSGKWGNEYVIAVVMTALVILVILFAAAMMNQNSQDPLNVLSPDQRLDVPGYYQE